MAGVPIYAGNLRAILLVSLLLAQKVWDDKWYGLITNSSGRIGAGLSILPSFRFVAV
jgi:hypothetical protein